MQGGPPTQGDARPGYSPCTGYLGPRCQVRALACKDAPVRGRDDLLGTWLRLKLLKLVVVLLVATPSGLPRNTVISYGVTQWNNSGTLARIQSIDPANRSISSYS